ncbi:MAG TPA: F0F1 ATP synthase subunit A [Actinomycetota bacterium]|nr:F0F1 ATP synthase subunit A [Actinomycetota bacterium]
MEEPLIDVNHLFFWDPILFEGTPFEVNRVVLLMFVAGLACVAFFWAGAKARLVPKGFFQNAAEQAYTFIRNQIAVDVIGPKDGPKYAPYLASLFFFIFFCNLLEIIPGINFPVTSRMGIPAALAFLTYVIFVFIGFKKQGFRYLKDTLFPPGVPTFVRPLLAVIEFASVFIIRPLTLAIRLLANMMAGHVLLTIFFLFTHRLIVEDFGFTSPLGLVTFVVACGLLLFEMMVITIQAYIFTLLTAFYISESIHGHGDHAETSEHDAHQVETQRPLEAPATAA